VLGGSARPDHVRAIAARASALGFSMSVGVVHDPTGRLRPLSPGEREVWNQFNGRRGGHVQVLRNFYSALSGYERNLVDGKPHSWRCRAGARYLYISEEGLVGRCSQHRDTPGIPIERYTAEDVQREFTAVKRCAPYCTIGCVHKVSVLDWWLDPFRKPEPAGSPRARVTDMSGCHSSLSK